MDQNKVFKNDKGDNIFRVVSTFNPKFEILFMHPEYCINTGKREMTETGYMVVFNLEVKNKALPSFIGRWDQKEHVLDIDIAGVDKKAVADFKAEKNGYSGHHPQRVSESPRLFKIKINTPEFKILEGNVTFNISHGHHPDLFKI